MGEIRERTKYQGVYQRRSEMRRDPRDGKPDICYYITYKDNARKKIWETIGWKSQGFTAGFARETLAQRLQVVKHGELIDNKQAQNDTAMTFGDAWDLYCEKWLHSLKRCEDEKGRYRNHIEPRFGSTPIDKIKAVDLETFKQELSNKGLSPASVKHVLGNMRRVYNKLAEWELFDGRVPTASVKMPKIDNARVRYLAHEEAEMLLSEIKKSSLTWWRISFISLNTGMRLGEVLSLTKGDIDFKSGVIYARYAKNKKRMVFMNDEVKAVINEIKVNQQCSLLFPSKHGELIKITDASKTFARVVHRLGLNPAGIDDSQKVVFHTLRHTFASWLAIEGVPLYVISKLLGHATIDMTQRYAHLCPDVKHEAVQMIGAVMRQHIERVSGIETSVI
jgi:Site-specific recombinase XerD